MPGDQILQDGAGPFRVAFGGKRADQRHFKKLSTLIDDSDFEFRFAGIHAQDDHRASWGREQQICQILLEYPYSLAVRAFLDLRPDLDFQRRPYQPCVTVADDDFQQRGKDRFRVPNDSLSEEIDCPGVVGLDARSEDPFLGPPPDCQDSMRRNLGHGLPAVIVHGVLGLLIRPAGGNSGDDESRFPDDLSQGFAVATVLRDPH